MLLYWLRIFKQLAIYVILVFKTIQDIAYFFIMFLVCIFMFGNAIYILNASRLRADSKAQPLFDTAFGYDGLDAILN